VENALLELREATNPIDLGSLETVIPLTQKTIEEVRRIVKDLRPSILDDLGILATIGWFCREFNNVYTGIRIETTIDIEEDEVPSHLKTIIYRILQEALNNVLFIVSCKRRSTTSPNTAAPILFTCGCEKTKRAWN
jgi:signal transduction histidine kinase